MPRLKTQVVVAVADPRIPAELQNPGHPVWQSVEAAEGWLSVYGIDTPDIARLDPIGRWLAGVRGWARLEGWTYRNPYKVVVTDWERLRSAGVLSPGRERNRDRLRGSCVSFAPREPVKRGVNRAEAQE